MNVAFIGLSYHFKNTKSTQFLIEVLRDFYGNVEVAANEDTWELLPRRKVWDLVLFFQHIPKRWELDSLRARAVVLVPMYDNCRLEPGFWKDYRDCKVLCFSSTMEKLLRSWGHDTMAVQYFPPVPERTIPWSSTKLSAFFWPRRPELNWTHIQRLLDPRFVGSVHLHLTEPTVSPNAQEKTQWDITTSSWFADPAELAVHLEQCQVYFAPRRFEGIGMSFLEAMALGMAVLSPNNPTMNEYLVSGVNGYLYDPDMPTVPDWTQAAAWGVAARKTCIDGRRVWLASLPSIHAWLDASPRRFPGRVVPIRRWGASWWSRLRRLKRWVVRRGASF